MAEKGYSYDVFLSYGGGEANKQFISFLYEALMRAGLVTFMDDKGNPPEEAIKSSKSAVVVLSDEYSGSQFCLDELVLIVERMRKSADNFKLMPIFYYRVNPGDIRNEKGRYNQLFEKHMRRFGDKKRIDSWRAALKTAMEQSGWIVKGSLDWFANNVVKAIRATLVGVSASMVSPSCHQFSLKDIEAATNQFDGSKVIGQGGEATVYLAEMYVGSDKTPVAVKHLKYNSTEFEKEILTLSRIQHPNLVSLLGFCYEAGHKILVYEYMAKGCLSDYVKNTSHDISLSWLQRLNICLGAARGLQHLHTETHDFTKGIIHRDVKPGNILVDENWVGKISDYGMCMLSKAGQDKSLMTTNLKGTVGYYAPEYIKTHRVTRKIDVYAFGVVLFEVLCRKMPWDREDESYSSGDDDEDEDEDLGFWAQKNVDAQIQGEISRDSLKVYTDIIERSLQANPGKRPTMDEVVLDLQKALECQDSENLPNQLEGSTLLLPKPPRGLEGITSRVKGHTQEEVSKHNKDVTPFMEDQPGGEGVLLSVAAKDATESFEEIGHSSTAIKMMESYDVGDIDASTIPPTKLIQDTWEFNVEVIEVKEDPSLDWLHKSISFGS